MKTRPKKIRIKRRLRTAADRRQTKITRVDSPYGHGTDIVPRIVDTVMALKARGVIGAREASAAERYERAFGVITTAGSSMTGESVGGGGPATTLAQQKVAAAEDIRNADRVLGLVDAAMMRGIVGEGRSISEYAGASASEADVKHIGRRFRDALGVLADLWLPEAAVGRSSGIRSHRDESASGSTMETPEIVERARVAHATGTAVKFTDGD